MPEPKPIRLLIADDHFVVRSGIAASLEMESEFAVVAEAETGKQAIELYRRVRPDAVLMDVRLPGTGGIEVTSRICAEFPEARVLMYSTFDHPDDIYRSVQAGAAGYVLKSAPREEVVRALRAVMAGERYLQGVVARRLAERLAGSPVSEREVQVLELIARGRSNKEIGTALHITEDTVKRHITHVFAKLRVRDRAQAATEAVRRGLIRLD